MMHRTWLKKDILTYLADHSGYPIRVCEQVLRAYHDLLTDTVKHAERLQDYGYLDLGVKFVPGHEKEDPRDHSKTIWVQDKYKLVLKAGDTLKRAAKNR